MKTCRTPPKLKGAQMTGKSRLDLKAQILVHPAAAHIILAVPATANPTLTPESRKDESPASPATWPLSGTRCIKLKARRCRPPGYYPPGRSSGARCSESPAMPAPGFNPTGTFIRCQVQTRARTPCLHGSAGGQHDQHQDRCRRRGYSPHQQLAVG